MTQPSRLRWCDLRCEHAEFPRDTAVDGSGSCMTFTALYCRLMDKYVQKNSPCAAGLEPAGESRGSPEKRDR